MNVESDSSTLIKSNSEGDTMFVQNEPEINDESDFNSDNDNESSDESEMEQLSFDQTTNDLRKWALSFNVSHRALDGLMPILSRRDICVPKTARTLLKTPHVTARIVDIAGGQYWHNGFGKCLEDFFR